MDVILLCKEDTIHSDNTDEMRAISLTIHSQQKNMADIMPFGFSMHPAKWCMCDHCVCIWLLCIWHGV